ncbi:hypothetical protein NC653_013741 [Populus alba x Populus x berolinensis]|uniref:Uncharacterized protein n=1 Tax=Populus alba x Populus x berolinensis TaxID=444605 RepID=A0AAD6W2X5_9ROSI|nr:hypothetical protein NC653_013741 [Populus alba x Populus x berolinensis]
MFKISRGQCGSWLAIAANLFFPETFSISRFIASVIVPNWLVDGLRNSIAGGMYFLSSDWNFVCRNEDSRNCRTQEF